MIEVGYSQNLGIDGLKAIMAYAYMDTQLDIAHQKETGKPLIVGYYARTPDQTVGSHVASVGRISHGKLLNVNGWLLRDGGSGSVWALPVVVPEAVEI